MYKWEKVIRKITLFIGVLIVSFVVSDFISTTIWWATLYFTGYIGDVGTFSNPIWLSIAIVAVIICSYQIEKRNYYWNNLAVDTKIIYSFDEMQADVKKYVNINSNANEYCKIIAIKFCFSKDGKTINDIFLENKDLVEGEQIQYNDSLGVYYIVPNLEKTSEKINICLKFSNEENIKMQLKIFFVEHEQEIHIKTTSFKIIGRKFRKTKEQIRGVFSEALAIPYDYYIGKKNDWEVSELTNACKKVCKKKFFLHYDADFGNGKTTQCFHTANELGKVPVYISPWEEGYNHDVLFLIYSKITEKHQFSVTKIIIFFLFSILAIKIDFIPVFKAFHNDIFVDNHVLLNIIYFTNFILPPIIAILLVSTLILYFIVTKMGHTKYLHKSLVKKIVKKIVSNNLILIIDDLDRIKNEETIVEVFTILSVINSMLPPSFNQCVGIVSYSSKNIKSRDEPYITREISNYENKIFFGTYNEENIDIFEYLLNLKNRIDNFIKRRIVVPDFYENLLAVNEELYNDCSSIEELSYRDVFQYKIIITEKLLDNIWKRRGK